MKMSYLPGVELYHRLPHGHDLSWNSLNGLALTVNRTEQQNTDQNSLLANMVRVMAGQFSPRARPRAETSIFRINKSRIINDADHRLVTSFERHELSEAMV